MKYGRIILVLMCTTAHTALAASVSQVDLSHDAKTLRLTLDCEAEYVSHGVVEARELVIQLRGPSCTTVSQELVGPALARFDRVRDKLSGISSQRVGERIELRLSFHQAQRFLVTQGRSQTHLSVLASADVDRSITQAVTVTPSINAEETLQSGKDLLQRGDAEQAIDLYLQVLAQPDIQHHPEALEFLGVAYEMSGQQAQALTQYQQFAERFPAHEDRLRIQQRFDSLEAQRAPREVKNPTRRNPWQVVGEVSQDYWQVSSELEDLTPDVNNPADFDRSTLLTLANFMAVRSGQRFDSRTQVSIGHNQEFDRPEGRDRNGLLVSQLYTEVFDQALGWRARIGRQTAYRDGILGRFDGLRASYQWRPGIQINVTGGLPVDTPQFAGDSNRQFIGASLDWRQPIEGLDLRLFTHAQNDDGVSARRAVGGDIGWRKGKWQVIAALDYDASYNVLNNGYVQVRVQPSTRLSLHADYNAFALPFLTTRNALIGQPTTRLDFLLDEYSDGQLRTIARHRTSDAQRYSTGMVADLSERWTLNADVTYTDITRSTTSAGVAAQPARQQFYTSVDFIGASLFKTGDSTNIGLRFDSTNVADTASLIFDLRLPFGDHLRINPRLVASYRETGASGTDQILAPSLRLTYLWGARYELEFEAGRRWQEQTFDEALLEQALFPFSEERQTEDLVALRWRVIF